ncbi:MAG: TfoX/Sxy family protein [Myxococcota bacterium]|nr:TfoX/Sxy family protein [Myxococcota bacterium]
MRARTEARVRALLSDRKDVVEKKVMGALAFMVDGSMCCSISDAGLLVQQASPS